MSDRLVVNASPVILLAKVNGLEWMSQLSAGPLIVPQAVLLEVEAGPEGREVVGRLQKLSVEVAADIPLPGVISAWDLGRGESQVLAACLGQVGRRAILDDRLARHCARALQVPIIGTMGIVVVARRRGWLPAARPVIARLQAIGMFIAPSLVEAILAEVGE